MRSWLWAAAALLAALPAPARAQPGGSGHPGQSVIDFSTADQRMNAAIARARETSGELLRWIEAADSGTTVAVKIRIAEGAVAEHMWLRDVRYEDGMVHGRLNNVPRDLHRVRLGDPLRVAPGEISDWMVVRRGVLCGGFTFRVSLSQMTPIQRVAVLRQQRILGMPQGDAVCGGNPPMTVPDAGAVPDTAS
jgi:uncharacterized protein YegJ (DUF2314 family)